MTNDNRLSTNNNLVVIVGPTASGKSELAMRVAKEFNGEIICADSRTIYKAMDIGTAKPLKTDQKAIQHWGLGLIEPGQRYSAARFKSYAEAKILDIQSRGKLPILVGGTGLYIDSVLFNFDFVGGPGPAKRAKLEELSTEKLQEIIKKRGYKMPQNLQNRRHLVGVIERAGQAGIRTPKPRKDALIIGLMPPDAVLKGSIASRAEFMFESGIIKETVSLRKRYGVDVFSPMAGIVYSICLRQINGKISQKQAIELFKIADWQYARRQRTWFRRNRYIKWFSSSEQAYKTVQKQLLNT